MVRSLEYDVSLFCSFEDVEAYHLWIKGISKRSKKENACPERNHDEKLRKI